MPQIVGGIFAEGSTPLFCKEHQTRNRVDSTRIERANNCVAPCGAPHFLNALIARADYSVAWVFAHEAGHFWRFANGINDGTRRGECLANIFAGNATGLGANYVPNDYCSRR